MALASAVPGRPEQAESRPAMPPRTDRAQERAAQRDRRERESSEPAALPADTERDRAAKPRAQSGGSAAGGSSAEGASSTPREEQADEGSAVAEEPAALGVPAAAVAPAVDAGAPAEAIGYQAGEPSGESGGSPGVGADADAGIDAVVGTTGGSAAGAAAPDDDTPELVEASRGGKAESRAAQPAGRAAQPPSHTVATGDTEAVLHEAGRSVPVPERAEGREPVRQAPVQSASPRPVEETRAGADAGPASEDVAPPIDSFGRKGDGLADEGSRADSREAGERHSLAPRDADVSRPAVRAFQSALTLAQSVETVGGAVSAPILDRGASAPTTPQERAANIGQLVQSMQVLVRHGIGEATVRLRPEHLGEVSVAIRLEGGGVVATIRAESAGVREWLQLQEDALRASLAQHGLSLDRLVVQRDGRQDRGDAEPQDQPRPRGRRHAAAAERFEVTV